MKHINTRIFTRKEMSEMNDIFQVDYLPNAKKIIINLPEEVWKNIDTIIMTRQFQEELVVEKQKESVGKEVKRLLELNRIYNMDNLEGMKLLDDNSVDSIVTDPPYGLSKEPNIIEVLTHWLNDEEYKHPSKGFMGKEWDSFVPGPAIWKEVFRVLKPGGHLLCFAGTRTYDLMCMSIRLAGFEIRDCIQWLYGSGFPKSHDISKAIDKKLGADREVIGKSRGVGKKGGETYSKYGGFKAGEIEITAPATPEAQQWDGWGTALKPANEPIVLARKPISEKTIAENVMKWGTGGLNIDGCRIGTEEIKTYGKRKGQGVSLEWSKYTSPEGYEGGIHQGRFPANVILDEEAGKLLDEQSGISKGSSKPRKNKGTGNICYGDYKTIITQNDAWGDSGGASRFFYCAKASKKERGEGNNHPTVKPLSLIKYLITLVTPPGGICLDPFEGSGTHALACKDLGFNYIGFELDKTYYNIATKRINA
jgi:DNA modification methylase